MPRPAGTPCRIADESLPLPPSPSSLVPAPASPASAPDSASTTSAPAASSAGSATGERSEALTQGWATATLTDVASGERFRIADLAGKVVVIEPMAIWCSNCRAQQRAVQEALAQLPAGQVVYVVLDVDPNEDAANLADYRVANDFEGRYVIAGVDVARALAADFGDQILNPPSTPMVIVGTDGTVTRTEFGHKSVDEIVDLAMAHGA